MLDSAIMTQGVQDKDGQKTEIRYRRDFSGISLAAYRRLLLPAIEAVAAAGISGDAEFGKLTGAGVAPHLAKVCVLWPLQQKKSMQKTTELLSRRRDWVARRHKTFFSLRRKHGDGFLESLFRVTSDGDIVFSGETGGDPGPLDRFEIEACLAMYPFYTLVIGASREVKSKLAEALAHKIS